MGNLHFTFFVSGLPQALPDSRAPHHTSQLAESETLNPWLLTASQNPTTGPHLPHTPSECRRQGGPSGTHTWELASRVEWGLCWFRVSGLGFRVQGSAAPYSPEGGESKWKGTGQLNGNLGVTGIYEGYMGENQMTWNCR